jgi:DNA-3-methyladenine glycosylase II
MLHLGTEVEILTGSVAPRQQARRMTDVSLQHRTTLAATPPFSFESSLRALGAFAPCASEHQFLAGRVRRALTLPPSVSGADRAVVVEVEQAPHPEPGVTAAVFAAGRLTRAERSAIEQAVRHWFGLTDDMAGFLSRAASDPPLAQLLDAAPGLHQVRFASLAEAAVYFTLTQRSTQWFATARKRRLAAEFGQTIAVDGATFTAFPSLATLRRLTEADLLPFAGTRHRAERLHSVIGGVAALDEEWLRAAPYEEARQALLSVPGIGAFTAHALLLRALGRPDDAPLELAQFTLAARAVYGDPPPSPAEIRERYRPWVGWWAYLTRTALDWLPAESACA